MYAVRSSEDAPRPLPFGSRARPSPEAVHHLGLHVLSADLTGQSLHSPATRHSIRDARAVRTRRVLPGRGGRGVAEVWPGGGRGVAGQGALMLLKTVYADSPPSATPRFAKIE